MSVVLAMGEYEGKPSAQTGNLVHSAAKWYHKTTGTEAARIAAGKEALEAARAEFPQGDAEKASKIFSSYVADRENKEAEVVWCEEPVRLTLKADPTDPTQEEIVIAGTLDQVRRKNGVLRVWDIKTGERYTAEYNVLKYLIQQSAYTLAARQTLDPEIQPGGLIFTPGYGKVRGKVHLPNPLTVEQCGDLLLTVPLIVSNIRRGERLFHPSPSACEWCKVGPWPKCHQMYKGFYG